MILYKQKNKSVVIENNKITKIKNKPFRHIALFLGLTIACAASFYGIVIQPKVIEAEKIIQENKDYMSSIDPNKDYKKVLFSEKYTDKDFNEDLQLFSKIHKNIMEGPVKRYSENLQKKMITDYFKQVVFQNNINHNISYNDILDLDKRSFSIKERNEKRAKKRELFGDKEKVLIYSSVGIHGFGQVDNSYDNLNKAFSTEYGKNSYLLIFMSKPYDYHKTSASIIDKETDKENEEKIKLLTNIFNAYNNKDYNTLRTYFKQVREFSHYMAGFNIGNVSYSYIGGDRSTESNIRDAVMKVIVFKKSIGKKDGDIDIGDISLY